MIFALSEVHFLSISMHSWRESSAGWLKVLRALEQLKELVFVREMIGSESDTPGYQLVDLEALDVTDYEFSGELWSSRILLDIERERQVWPLWKTPRVVFKAIANNSTSGRAEMRRSRERKPGNSWRR